MTKQDRSVQFSGKFYELFKKELFAKTNYNLIAMNGGGNSPYRIPTALRGCSVGVKFTDEETFLEFYIKESKIKQVGFINAFIKQAELLKRENVKISDARVEGDFNLYLIPVDYAHLENSCRRLQQMCDVMSDLEAA